MTIQIYNTLGRKKEKFETLEKGKVRMYVCGPTVYDFAHIGNFRTYILSDIVQRTLKYLSFKVR